MALLVKNNLYTTFSNLKISFGEPRFLSTYHDVAYINAYIAKEEGNIWRNK